MIIPGKLYLMEVHYMESRTPTPTSLTSCVDKVSWNILLYTMCIHVMVYVPRNLSCIHKTGQLKQGMMWGNWKNYTVL